MDSTLKGFTQRATTKIAHFIRLEEHKNANKPLNKLTKHHQSLGQPGMKKVLLENEKNYKDKQQNFGK